jgi:uncharacterized sporulation protein YeaH/YhbH (DUF444 family)
MTDKKEKLFEIFQKLKDAGLSSERENGIREELMGPLVHVPVPGTVGEDDSKDGGFIPDPASCYLYHDLLHLQDFIPPQNNYGLQLQTLDELLERDKKREKDGFPRKIRVGRLIKPGRSGKDKVVVVPTTVEEKLLHDRVKAEDEQQPSGGSGEGEEGEVIGEQPVRESEQGSGQGPGQGEGGGHEMESSAYDLGKVLTEKFELPNLKEKGKKRSLTRYTYDLTDRNRGFGQLLDKKATLRKIVETNISLGRLPDPDNIDTTGFLVGPESMIYRILSREKDYESQAVVFFLRDYSGSMAGKVTDLVVTQHVLIYSWLLYQYDRQVESRFILHDTEATEVPDFYTYYNSKVAGGTQVSSAYQLVNEIVEKENLASEYNIYVFHGTDGDDWDTDGREAIPELKKMLRVVNRMGITIAEHPYGGAQNSEVERYIRKSGLLESKSNLLRMNILREDADEPALIEGIKKMIS